MTTSKTLIFIIGSQAIGKMMVGQELSRATGYEFMSNHQTIEMLLPIFDYGSPSFRRLLFDFRLSIFEEAAASELSGLIVSFVPVVSMFKSWSLASNFGPTPHNADTGSGARNSVSPPASTTQSAWGECPVVEAALPQSLAILATILLLATPKEQDRPSSSQT